MQPLTLEAKRCWPEAHLPNQKSSTKNLALQIYIIVNITFLYNYPSVHVLSLEL